MKPDEKEKVANIVPFGLRLQPELKRRVEEAAKANSRSLNAEIAARLEKSLDDEIAWLSNLQDSPSIKFEKRLLLFEARLEEQIDSLKECLLEHEKRIEALEQRSQK